MSDPRGIFLLNLIDDLHMFFTRYTLFAINNFQIYLNNFDIAGRRFFGRGRQNIFHTIKNGSFLQDAKVQKEIMITK